MFELFLVGLVAESICLWALAICGFIDHVKNENHKEEKRLIVKLLCMTTFTLVVFNLATAIMLSIGGVL